MNTLHSNRFDKKIINLDSKILAAFQERFSLFRQNPFHPLLNNHKLSGDRKDQRSINITGDWRLIFEQVDSHTIRLLDIDTHRNLYGK